MHAGLDEFQWYHRLCSRRTYYLCFICKKTHHFGIESVICQGRLLALTFGDSFKRWLSNTTRNVTFFGMSGGTSSDWLSGADVSSKLIKSKDVVRSMCADGIWVLAKEEKESEWIFKRTMLRLEKGVVNLKQQGRSGSQSTVNVGTDSSTWRSFESSQWGERGAMGQAEEMSTRSNSILMTRKEYAYEPLMF